MLLVSWWLMLAVHELGHVLGAWLTGGMVTEVDLHPLRISRTAVDPNPRPVIVAWSGPIIGVLLPLLAWYLAGRSNRPGPRRITPWLRFFSGFCLIANGAYLASGLWQPVGDAADLLRLSVPVWQLALFGFTAFAAGLWCWHGLGRIGAWFAGER